MHGDEATDSKGAVGVDDFRTALVQLGLKVLEDMRYYEGRRLRMVCSSYVGVTETSGNISLDVTTSAAVPAPCEL